MITAPKGRGWAVITTTEQSDKEIINLMGGFDESADLSEHNARRWRSLRRKVSHGPAVRIRKTL